MSAGSSPVTSCLHDFNSEAFTYKVVKISNCCNASQHIYFSRVSCALTTALLSVSRREWEHEPDLGLSSTHGLNFRYQQEKKAQSRKAAAASGGSSLKSSQIGECTQANPDEILSIFYENSKATGA